MENYFNVEEAAKILSYSKKYLYKLMSQKKIPYYKPTGGRALFKEKELEDFVNQGKQSSREELEDRAMEILLAHQDRNASVLSGNRKPRSRNRK